MSAQVEASHGYDTFLCPEAGCVWGAAFPCVGACDGSGSPFDVPIAVLFAIGEHAQWHEREDVQAGRVRVVWDEDRGDFVEVATI